MNSHKSYTAALPKKRMGAGCLFFNEEWNVLLVKPRYKPGWEIPGGVVESHESPKQCCSREVREELGLQRRIGNLLVVDYNSETEERTESLMFTFYGGILNGSDIDSIQLRQEELPTEMTQTLCNRIRMAWQQVAKNSAVYLENQQEV